MGPVRTNPQRDAVGARLCVCVGVDVYFAAGTATGQATQQTGAGVSEQDGPAKAGQKAPLVAVTGGTCTRLKRALLPRARERDPEEMDNC